MPAVSVVIPCYDSAAFLRETVASVTAQTRDDVEIVFADDGSTDDTRGLIERIVAAEQRLPMRVVAQANAGVASARNLGIRAARGRYILPLDDDDLIAPTMIEECAAILDAEADVDVAYTDREDFGDVEGVARAGGFDLQRLKYFNQLGYCSLYRRTMWESVGGYRTNVTGFDDWDFWLAAAASGAKGRHLPKPLLRHRRRRDSLLWRLLPEYERLNAQVILNNATVYTPLEVDAARRFIEQGEPSSMLRAARRIFMSRYYEGYATAATANGDR